MESFAGEMFGIDSIHKYPKVNPLELLLLCSFDIAKRKTPSTFHNFLDYYIAENTILSAYSELGQNEYIFVLKNEGFETSSAVFKFDLSGVTFYLIEHLNNKNLITNSKKNNKAYIRTGSLDLSRLLTDKNGNPKKDTIIRAYSMEEDEKNIKMICEIIYSNLVGVIDSRQRNPYKLAKHQRQISG